jgi:predicted metal-dependent phosphoesterase TrpH
MRKIAIDKIKPGMKLAKAVQAQNGMVMLSEGTELTEKWIERIEDMGLDGIFIDAPAEQTLSREDALAQLDARFKLVANQPRMLNIKNILRKHIEGLYG